MAEKLQPSICTNYDDICFIHIGKYAVERGCLNELSASLQNECQQNNNKCVTCTTETNKSPCNSHKIKMENCIECDSTEDDHCHDQPELYKNKVCTEFMQWQFSTEREGCYLHQVCVTSRSY